VVEAYNSQLQTQRLFTFMKKPYELGAFIVALILSASVVAGELGASGIKVEGAWARATWPGQDTALVDFIITVKGERHSALVGISSPIASLVEMHSTKADDSGMMKMRELKQIDLPLGEPFALGLHGQHVMLVGLKKPLTAGEKFPLILTIKMGQESTKVKVSVETKLFSAVKNGSR
jgi:copper(I)-binding protein